jgi:hypothetical protein
MSNILYNIVMTLFFDIMDREAKGFLPCSIFIITRHVGDRVITVGIVMTVGHRLPN